MRIVAIPLLTSLALPVAAQPGFPVDKSYKAISISGFDVQNKGLSLIVSKRSDGGDLRGAGNAGCNNWSASVILRDEQIDFTDIVTTKKMCGKPVMTAEDAFLTSLRSAKRWHVEGDKLIIEGDAARLMLRPGVAELKVEKKPAKRSLPAR
ncbi:MAG: heat shock protein HslJ [Alphaproteobacteria bacterium]|nr:heat shock protein HslJ [Alphaproteobacteria bacterium]